MEDIINEPDISVNERLINDQWFNRMQKTSDLTAAEGDCQQINERESYTTQINRLQRRAIFIIPLTPGPFEEFGVDSNQEIDNEWATIAKRSRGRWSKENPY